MHTCFLHRMRCGGEAGASIKHTDWLALMPPALSLALDQFSLIVAASSCLPQPSKTLCAS